MAVGTGLLVLCSVTFSANAGSCSKWHLNRLRVGMSLEEARNVYPPDAEFLHPGAQRGPFGQAWRRDGNDYVFISLSDREYGVATVEEIRIIGLEDATGFPFEELMQFWHQPTDGCRTEYAVHYVWEDPDCDVVARASLVEGVHLISLSRLSTERGPFVGR